MRYVFDNIEEFHQRKRDGRLRGHKQYRRILAKNLPPFHFDYYTIVKATGQVKTRVLGPTIQRHPGEEMLYQIGSLEMMDLLDYHREIHHNSLPADPDGLPVHLFVDNIREAKASARSVCVYAIKFKDCALTYPVCIVRPVKGKTGIDYDAILRGLIADLHGSGMRIVHVIADAPKRGELRCVLQHQSDVACDYCKGSVTKIRNTEGRVVGKAWLTNGDPLRTKEWMLHVLDNWEDYTEEERFGIKSKSPLFTIPNFDPIHDMPPEYMHSMCLGVVRVLTELTMNVTKKTMSKNASFTRISVEQFDAALENVRVPQEFSRRIRHLDPAVWKAEEYRNLILFFFPAVVGLTKLPPEGQNWATKSLRTLSTVTTLRSDRWTQAMKAQSTTPELITAANFLVRMLWNTLTFLLRIYTLPVPEFDYIIGRYVTRENLIMWQNRFVHILGKTHGAWNCPYNVHHVTHLHLLREKGPLWHTSAFYGECMFSKLQRVARPESRNPIRVQLDSVYSCWRAGHACQKSLTVAPEGKNVKFDDSLFYTFAKGTYTFYKVMAGREDCVLAHKVIVGEFVDRQRYGNFSWKRVGVFTFVRVKDEEDAVLIKKVDISGKAILVVDLIMTVANGLLRETASI